MKEKEQILLESAKEYYKSAETSLKNNQYNSAVVLFFKSLIAFSDLYLLRTYPYRQALQVIIPQAK